MKEIAVASHSQTLIFALARIVAENKLGLALYKGMWLLLFASRVFIVCSPHKNEVLLTLLMTP